MFIEGEVCIWPKNNSPFRKMYTYLINKNFSHDAPKRSQNDSKTDPGRSQNALQPYEENCYILKTSWRELIHNWESCAPPGTSSEVVWSIEVGNPPIPKNLPLGIHACYLVFRGSGTCGNPWLGWQRPSGQDWAADPSSNNTYYCEGWTKITSTSLRAMLKCMGFL